MLTKRTVVLFKVPNNLVFRCLSSSVTSSHESWTPVKNGPEFDKQIPVRPGVCVEGYQGSTNTVPLSKARQLLANALTQAHQQSPAFQGIQGHQWVTSRSIHTRSSLWAQPEVKQVMELENSPEGIQGDHCVHQKLWMESCRRYGLANCDQQLEGIQSGRKTLAEVLEEQDKLIARIAEKYRNEVSNLYETDTSVQAAQGKGAVIPTVDAPCPQGIQGEECNQFKLWLENCHRFGFNECQDQFRHLKSGGKSLYQVFREQDDLIKDVVHEHLQKRSYSTSTNLRFRDVAGGVIQLQQRQTDAGSEPSDLSQTQKLKRAVKEYGSTVVVFHVGISLMSLGGCYLAVSSGVDVIGLLAKAGVGETFLESKAVAGAGTFVMAYAVHKMFAPVRIAMTLTATPLIVRHLRKIGFLKVPKVKPADVK